MTTPRPSPFVPTTTAATIPINIDCDEDRTLTNCDKEMALLHSGIADRIGCYACIGLVEVANTLKGTLISALRSQLAVFCESTIFLAASCLKLLDNGIDRLVRV
uniref:Saposin B-type domain-containing protein n=1 Tax=Ditylenchus dipsaci TaxID=166011 RepID=A0A915D4W7_9BILA